MMNIRRKLLTFILAALAVGGLWAQDAGSSARLGNDAPANTKLPDYFGFYVMNIPHFGWSEGAKISGQFQRWRGTLDLSQPSRPFFAAQGRDPIPLSFAQVSSLMLSVKAATVFDLVGVEGSSTSPMGTTQAFFVPFYAEVSGQTISLVPTMKTDRPAAESRGRRGLSP